MRYLKLLLSILSLIIVTLGHSQTIDVGDGVVVAHFNASWNEVNAVPWIEDINECNLVLVDISTNQEIMKRWEIIVVPTIVLFKDGEEIKRWQANVAFKIETDVKTVQEAVDEQNLSDF